MSADQGDLFARMGRLGAPTPRTAAPPRPRSAPPAGRGTTLPGEGETETRKGTVQDVHYQAPGGDFRVLSVKVGGKVQKWAGKMPPVTKGQDVSATGRATTHAEHGDQFAVDDLTVGLPTSTEGLEHFLVGLKIPGLGPKTIRKIVERFGDTTEQALDQPLLLAQVRGVSGDLANRTSAGWKAAKAEREIVIQLQQFGATSLLANRIHEHYKRLGKNAVEVVTEDPYRLALDVDGVGFTTADQIALKMGVAADSIQRVRAGVLHALHEGTNKGHCYLPLRALCDVASEMLMVDPGRVDQAIDWLEEGERVIVEPVGEEHAVFPRRLHVAEQTVTARLLRLLAAAPDPPLPAEGEPPVRGAPALSIELADRAIAAFEKGAGITMAPAQRDAVRMAAQHKVLILTGGPGCGKCLRVGTPVLAFDGTVKPVEQVRDGDLLMGPDSTPRRVQGCMAGRGPLFEIRPVKGVPWTCNEHHVLTLVRSGGTMGGRTIDVPLDEYMRLPKGAKWRQRGKLLRTGVEFPERSTALDPYVLGVWLGDGHRADTRVTKPDPEIGPAIEAEALRLGLRYERRWNGKKGCFEHASTRTRYRRIPNPMLDAVREALDDNLGKFIPDAYKVNSRERRLALLAGLMDTDGHHQNGGCEIISKWPRLANDIAFLARSLGFAAYVSDKHVRLPQWNAPRMYYRVFISGDLSVVPCKIARKRPSPRQQIKNVLRTGFDVVPVGEGDFYGFELDGDGRFLLGDFTVTHNTTITQALLRMTSAACLSVKLCAPTGRAAKRMNEATGRPASTIHRMLKWIPGEHAFEHNRNNPVPTNVLVVDEASMLDAPLASQLLDALPDGARVVLVGDVDQLPSVGPGAVLRDLIASEVIPTVRLTEIFRQAKGSTISIAAAAVNAGKAPVSDTVLPPAGAFYWQKHDDPKAAQEEILSMVTRRIPEKFGIPADQIQVLTPMHEGLVGTIALNQALQAALNPDPTGAHRGRMRPGDRVIVTKNNKDLDVSNGDIGRVLRVDPDDADASLVVEIDGREVEFPHDKVNTVQLAYTISIHKSQGGGFSCVVVCMMRQHWMLLSRNLLYTAMTRGKKLVVLVADPRAVRTALSAARKDDRNTRLADRLREAVSR